MEGFKNMQNLFEVRKTVRFGLKSYENKSSKNENYNIISQNFKENSEVKEKLEKYKERITESSDKEQWKEKQDKLQDLIKKIKQLSESIQATILNLDQIKNDSQYNFSINFKVSFIKKSCGFGKSLIPCNDIWKYEYDSNENKKICKSPLIISISQLLKNNKVENIKKYSDDFEKCHNKFEAYKLFIENKLFLVEEKTRQLNNLLQNWNHEKARLAEFYLTLQNILKNLEIVDKIYHQSIIFGWWVKEKVAKLRYNIFENKTSFEVLNNNIQELLEEIHDPKHGYEIWKATLHYRTINKRFIPNDKVQDVEKLLGHDSVKWGEFNNPLAKFSSEILGKIKGKVTWELKDRRLEIEKWWSIIEKAKKVIELIKEIKGINEKDITLWNICNALNNKKQTYNEFITQEVDFDDLGWKQKLKFWLTVLVDCDIYRPTDFIWRCGTLKNWVEKYLETINFTKYSEYKEYTRKISNGDHKKNKIDRWNLVCWHLSRDFVLVNREISQIRWALQTYIKYLQDNETWLNTIQYFSILAKDKNDENIALLIERDKAKEFYEKIYSKDLKSGNEKLYLYDSLTEKSLKKLFNQVKSLTHPFKDFKQELADKKYKEFDEIKFDDLELKELKGLLKKDIATQETWESKFEKFYNKLDNFKDKKEMLAELTKNAFIFQEKSFDLEYIKWLFPDLKAVKLEMNTNQKKESIHQNYYEKAFMKMLKHEDVDIKINPEFQIYYTPEEDENIKIEKIKEKQWKMSLEQLEKNHRFWRSSVTLWITIEIDTKKPNKETSQTTRYIGIDRWEKKIATLCHLEKWGDWEFILPIEYYDEDNLNIIQKTYFLDLAQFKISRLENGKQIIIKMNKNLIDANIELKKYEFITRFIKTIWIKDNRDKIKKVLGKFENAKINDTDYVRKFINDLIHTDKQEKDEEIENKIFNNHLIWSYQEKILEDTFVLSKLVEIIVKFNEFNFKAEETDILKQQDLELQKVRFRDVLSSNIVGIVNFLFKENKEQVIETFCALENLHNSHYRNFASEDKTSEQILINEDFVESTHNKLYQTSIYGKVEQAIMNKLQVYNDNEQKYLNYSFDEKRKNQTKEIQFELKEHSKTKREIEEIFQWKILKIQETKLYGNIAFVDPAYTSHRCPKCNTKGGDVKRKNLKDYEDKIECGCNYKSSLTIEIKYKIKLEESHTIISTGDENGAFFIWLRALKTKNDFNT